MHDWRRRATGLALLLGLLIAVKVTKMIVVSAIVYVVGVSV